MGHRHEQMGASIHRGLQELVARGFQDPRIAGLITITSVKVSPDLRHASVLVSVLPAEKQELTLHGLKSASRFIRRELGELIDTRQLPELNFKLDETLKKEAAVLERIRLARESSPGEPGHWPKETDERRDGAEGGSA